MDERRSWERVNTSMLGTIKIADTAVVCEVVNFADGGARLRVPGAQILPGIITLHLPRWGRLSQARIRWRQLDEVGISFEGS
jgi:hypothetical protein